MPLNGGESFFPVGYAFLVWALSRIWKTAARERSPFFNRACASFPIVRFCGGNITWQNPDFSGFPLQGYVLTNLFLSPSFCRMEGLWKCGYGRGSSRNSRGTLNGKRKFIQRETRFSCSWRLCGVRPLTLFSGNIFEGLCIFHACKFFIINEIW